MFQGLLRAHKDYQDTKYAMARLWVHECFRVFSDRLVGEKDLETFLTLLTEKLGVSFDLIYHNLCPNKQPPLFGEISVQYCSNQSPNTGLFTVKIS